MFSDLPNLNSQSCRSIPRPSSPKDKVAEGRKMGAGPSPPSKPPSLTQRKPTEAGIKHSLDFLSWILSPIYMTPWMSPKQGKVSIPLSYPTNQKLGLEFCMHISAICIPLVHIPQHFLTPPTPPTHTHLDTMKRTKGTVHSMEAASV